MEWTKETYRISDNPDELDLFYIESALQQSYWATGRPRDVIETSIANSLCLGLYIEDRQIGFARVVTDTCTFAWICDVLIHPDYQRSGLGKWLTECLLQHPDLINVKQLLLRTRDAHGLYEQFGFEVCEAMVRRVDRA